jgi:hypothetical protein
MSKIEHPSASLLSIITSKGVKETSGINVFKPGNANAAAIQKTPA